MRTVITFALAVFATIMVMTHLQQVLNFLIGMVILGIVLAMIGNTRGTGGKIVRGTSRMMWRTLRTSAKLVLR